MEYALAKELKEAGYPIQFSEAKFYMNKPWEATLSPETEHYGYVFPTLEELIDACGDKLGSINYWPTCIDKKQIWEVSSEPRFHIGKPVYNEFVAYGSTPTEAVARLWLALNKRI